MQTTFYFNPRSRFGERLRFERLVVVVLGISIHALREESDLRTWVTGARITTFQSTLSVRRATRRQHPRQPSGFISIHALREESDSSVRSSPRGVTISIHALREESDRNRCQGQARQIISIHALREESDFRIS